VSIPAAATASGGRATNSLIRRLVTAGDASIVNIALPSAQHALGFTTADRQWVVTAYALAFGSLLLFGGRLGDLIGRKITFLAGALGFAAASAVGGAATSFAMLVAARRPGRVRRAARARGPVDPDHDVQRPEGAR
jgi:MFS family permease